MELVHNFTVFNKLFTPTGIKQYENVHSLNHQNSHALQLRSEKFLLSFHYNENFIREMF
jgi:hypothetical protein